jgi:hypothetical protein
MEIKITDGDILEFLSEEEYNEAKRLYKEHDVLQKLSAVMVLLMGMKTEEYITGQPSSITIEDAKYAIKHKISKI